MIQSIWKGVASRRYFDVLMKCVVMIQSSYSGHQSRQADRKLRASTIRMDRQVNDHHAFTHDLNIYCAGSVRQTLAMYSYVAAVRI
jgi:uncharacterized protein YcbX